MKAIKRIALALLLFSLTACSKSDVEQCVDAAMAKLKAENGEAIKNWPPGGLEAAELGYRMQCTEAKEKSGSDPMKSGY